MRKYYDIMTGKKECIEFGRELGYDRVLFEEVNYCRPSKPADIKAVKGKLNIVKGSDIEVNRKAVRKEGVHVLIDPVSDREKQFDSAVASVATDNNVSIGFTLDLLLSTTGLARVRLLRNTSMAISLCEKAKTPVIIASGARDKYGMRAPQDLASIGMLFGLNNAKCLWAVSEAPKAIIEEAGI